MDEGEGGDALDTGTWMGTRGGDSGNRDGADERLEDQQRAEREWSDEAYTLETAAVIMEQYGYGPLAAAVRGLVHEIRGNVAASRRYIDARERTSGDVSP